MKGLILISAYNCASTIGDVLQDLSTYTDLDILVVNDGSTDNTLDIVKKAGIRIISHKNNLGKGAALQTGFNYAKDKNIDFVLTMDADKQHPAAQIRDFIKVHEQYPNDVILGKRKRDQNMPITRKLSNSISALLISWRIGQRIYDAQCGFRLIPKKYLSWHFSNIKGFIYESEVLITLALNKVNFRFIPIPTIYPETGETKMTYFDSTFGFIFMYISSFFKPYKKRNK